MGRELTHLSKSNIDLTWTDKYANELTSMTAYLVASPVSDKNFECHADSQIV